MKLAYCQYFAHKWLDEWANREYNGCTTRETPCLANGGEDTLAFCCVLYLKEECDGCGLCEERRRLALMADEWTWLQEWDV